MRAIEPGDVIPRRILLLVAAGELLAMTLWFSATAASPAIASELGMDPGPLRIVPAIAGCIGWRWAFLVLVPGPVPGALETSRLARCRYCIFWNSPHPGIAWP